MVEQRAGERGGKHFRRGGADPDELVLEAFERSSCAR
jgi:hypothetical protein